MKKYLYLLLVLPFASNAQQDSIEISDRIIKVLPFAFISNTFMIEMESFNKDLDESLSLGLGLTSADMYDGEILGFKGEITKRFYITGLSIYTPKRTDRNPYIRGIYAGVSLAGGYAEQTQNDGYWIDTSIPGNSIENTKSGYFFFPGVTIGFVRSFWDVLFMEVYVGGGVRVAKYSNSNSMYDDNQNYYYEDVNDYFYKGVAPKIGLNLGIGF